MNNIYELSIISFIVSAGIVYLITPFIGKLVTKWGLIDDPKLNKHPKVTHTVPTPRGGGLGVFIGIFIATLLFLPLDKHIAGILAGALILTLMGLIDDKKDLNPYLRLGFQFIAAGIPIVTGIGIAFASNPFGGLIDLSHPQFTFTLFGQERTIWLAADLFALLWIVTLINFINMGAKGLPGQLSGVVIIAALTLAALSLKFSADIAEWPVTVLALILAGAFLGFLPWHMYPQKIMPSFSGSNLAGYLLGILSILTTAKVGTLALVLGVPLIDTGYTILRRLASGNSPVWGDRGHLHHKLIDKKGWSREKVTYFYWLVTAILGFLSLYLNAQTKFYTMVGIALLLGGVILWLTYRPKN